MKKKCDQCQAEYTTGRWYWYDATRPFEYYRCHNCYVWAKRKTAERTEVEQKRLETRREMVEKQPLLTKCDSCGTTEGRLTRCLELEMVICMREFHHWRRHGRLTPDGSIKVQLPLDKCGSCGTTEGPLIRCTSLTMVLCRREYHYWRRTGRLSPKRQQAPKRST